MTTRIVVGGAGQAGFAAAAKLRQETFEGAITLLGAEKVMPYQRPPLSKAYLLSKLSAERLSLRNEAFYLQQGIDIRPDEPALSIDRARRTVETSRSQLILRSSRSCHRVQSGATAGTHDARCRSHLLPEEQGRCG